MTGADFLPRAPCDPETLIHSRPLHRLHEVSQTGAVEREIGQNLPFEERWRNVSRLAWLVMGSLVLAAATGLLGRGPLARANAAAPSGQWRVEYDRFLRAAYPTDLTLELQPGVTQSGRVRVELRGGFGKRVRVQGVLPPPAGSEPLADGVAYTFVTPAGAPARITLQQDPGGMGPVPSQILVANDTSLTISQFVFP